MNTFKKTLLVLGTVAGLSGNAEAHHIHCEKSTFPGAINAESYTCQNDAGDLVYTGQLDSKNLKFDGFGVSMTKNFAYMGMWEDGKMNGHFIRFARKYFVKDTSRQIPTVRINAYYYNYAFVAKNDMLETEFRVPTLESKGLRDYVHGMIDTVLNQQGAADVDKHNTIYNNTINPDVVISKLVLDEKSKPVPVAKVSKSNTILALFTNFFETAFQQLVNFTVNHFSETYDPEWNYAYLELGVCVLIFLVSVYWVVDEYEKERIEKLSDVGLRFKLYLLISTSLIGVTVFVPGFWTWLIVSIVTIIWTVISWIILLFIVTSSHRKIKYIRPLP